MLDDRFRVWLAARADVQPLHEEADDLRREDRGAVEAVGARRDRSNVGRLVASVRGPIPGFGFAGGGDRPADAERARDLADLPPVGADDGAGDVVARRQERQRDRSLERAAIRRVGGGRLHAAGGAVERARLLVLRDLEHHRRVLQDVRRIGVQLDVAVDHARRELAADDRRGAARAGLLVGDEQVGRAHCRRPASSAALNECSTLPRRPRSSTTAILSVCVPVASLRMNPV